MNDSAWSDEMNPIDELLADAEMQGPTFAGEPTERKHTHRWVRTTPMVNGVLGEIYFQCVCGKVRDEVKAKRGKSSLMRSKREERGLAKNYLGKRTGHFGGPDDVQTGLLNIQSKAGTGWWSLRYAAELDKLPRTGGRVPALIVSNGKPGHLVRRFVVMDERDYRALYGDRILDGDAA